MILESIIDKIDLLEALDHPKLRIFDCTFASMQPEQGFQTYLEGHIPGAQYLNLNQDLSDNIIPGKTGRHPFPNPEVFIENMKSWGISNDSILVLYDASNCAIASRAWFIFKFLGLENVSVLNGGFKKWRKAKLPVDTTIQSFPQGNFEQKKTAFEIISVDELEGQTKSLSCQLLDSRSHVRFLGEQEPFDPIAGHIPGATSFPYEHNLQENGYWKSKEELRTRFEEANLQSGDIFYCGSGVTACHNILAMEYASLGSARLYPGSWSEWILKESRIANLES